MTIQKSKCGKFYSVRITPHGRKGKDIRRRVKTKSEALKVERYLLSIVEDEQEWNNFGKKDPRSLLEVIDDWYELNGKGLDYSKGRYQKLCNLCGRVGNPLAHSLTSDMLIKDRNKRLDANLSKNTVNRDIAYVRAMFNDLIRVKQWKHENPATGIRQEKVDDTLLTYLDDYEIRTLLDACKESRNKDLHLVVLTCLSTGGRIGEVTALKPEQLKNNSIQFFKTKSGKRRRIPIDERLYRLLKQHDSGSEKTVFSGSCTEAFENAIEKAKITLPENQCTHVLRHTFAVNFIQDGGNIKDLQKALGHTSITTTAIYLEFAPDHLEDVVSLNPISKKELF